MKKKNKKGIRVWLTMNEGLNVLAIYNHKKPSLKKDYNFYSDMWTDNNYVLCGKVARKLLDTRKFKGNKILKGRIVFIEEMRKRK